MAYKVSIDNWTNEPMVSETVETEGDVRLAVIRLVATIRDFLAADRIVVRVVESDGH